MSNSELDGPRSLAPPHPQNYRSVLVRWHSYATARPFASQTLGDAEFAAIEAKLAERATAVGVSPAELKQMNITIPKTYKARDYVQ